MSALGLIWDVRETGGEGSCRGLRGGPGRGGSEGIGSQPWRGRQCGVVQWGRRRGVEHSSKTGEPRKTASDATRALII